MIPARPRPEKSAENREIDQYRLKYHIEGHRWGHTGTLDIRPQGPMHPNTLGLHIPISHIPQIRPCAKNQSSETRTLVSSSFSIFFFRLIYSMCSLQLSH